MEKIIRLPEEIRPQLYPMLGKDPFFVGGEFRKMIGYDPIPHPNIERIDIVAQQFQRAIGFDIPNMKHELKSAYDAHEDLRKTNKDIDLLVDPENLHPLQLAMAGAIGNFRVRMRRNPWGASLYYPDGTKVDLTSNRPSPFNARTADCHLSIDRLGVSIIKSAVPELNVLEKTDLGKKYPILEIVGDMATMDTERALALTVGLISKSQIKKEGQKIEISFGKTAEEIKYNKELLILSLSLILLDKNKYQKFYDRLLYNVLNWENLDPKIQNIIVLAFQFVNYQQNHIN